MKTIPIACLCGLAVWSAACARTAAADEIVPAARDSGTGTLRWQPTASQGIARVEWAAGTGAWHRTWQSLAHLDGIDGPPTSAAVAIAFRVVTMSNFPPAGMVFIDTGVFAMGDGAEDADADAQPVHT
jgi:hypothetical protein